MKPRYRYKARHSRNKLHVIVRIMVQDRENGWVATRAFLHYLPHNTSTKDIHRYKQTMCEIERQKDLDKECK